MHFEALKQLFGLVAYMVLPFITYTMFVISNNIMTTFTPTWMQYKYSPKTISTSQLKKINKFL